VLNSLKGLWITLQTTLRRPVTAHYPKEHLPLQERFMGFPVLTWDKKVGEPYCVACMVCIRECPTQCMSATMMDNPLYTQGKSSRRKMVESFEINLGRCIVCGICEDVCNFDAITMSHQHEISSYVRNGRRADMKALLAKGTEFQKAMGWRPPTEVAKEAAALAKGQGSPAAPSAPQEGAA
jgi:NADH-quinone oxidoreductase subunit I